KASWPRPPGRSDACQCRPAHGSARRAQTSPAVSATVRRCFAARVANQPARSCPAFPTPFPPGLLQFPGLGDEFGPYHFDVAAGVEHPDPMGMPLGAIMIGLASALEELGPFLLEAVEFAAARQAFAGGFKRHVEKPGAVGLQMRVHPLFERADPFGPQT